MRINLLLTCGVSLLLIGCGEKSESTLPRAFMYTGRYYPSFMPGVILTIRTSGSQGSMTRLVYEPNSDSTFAAIDSVRLTAADVRYFFTQLKGIPLISIKPEEYPSGFDGITVYNEVVQDGQQNAFEFWSPTRKNHPREHQLVEAVLGLYRRRFTTLSQQEYLRKLERYFDFGRPRKGMDGTPEL
jgi:hypothetical protein